MALSYNEKTLTKNVVFLYIRMLLMMLISLITSRVVLDQLGVVDFGIYNVVGSLIVLFSFIQGSLSSSASRYLAFEIGSGTEKTLNRAFCMTLNIHLIFAILIFLGIETIGLWYFYNKMVIPENRLLAASIVFQLSNLSAIATLLAVPYNSMLIAQERMKEFAYLSIVESIVKLAIAYSLYLQGIDKLILYGVLMFLAQVLTCFLYFHYCRKHFVSTNFTICWDKKLFKEMMAYNGWSITSYISANFVSQISNLLLNMFFGPAINAARAISYQVQTNVQKFVVNFQIALNPQVIKQYAAGDKRQVISLATLSTKIAFCLLLIILFPLLVNIDFILSLWLKDVPEYTNIFVVLVCIAAALGSMANVFSVIAQAANRLKLFSLTTMPLYLLYIPTSYIALKHGARAWFILAMMVIVQFVELILKYLLAQYIMNICMNSVLQTILRCLCSLIIFIILGEVLYLCQREVSLIYSLLSIIYTALIAAVWCFIMIFNKKDRAFVYNYIKARLNKR